MSKALRAVSYSIEKVEPRIDENNQVVAYDVQYNVRYEDSSGHSVQIRETDDLWLVASQTRKDEVQAIQDLIKQRLDATVLG